MYCILDIRKVETKEFSIEYLLRARDYGRFYRAVVPKLMDFTHTHTYIYGRSEGTKIDFPNFILLNKDVEEYYLPSAITILS